MSIHVSGSASILPMQGEEERKGWEGGRGSRVRGGEGRGGVKTNHIATGIFC